MSKREREAVRVFLADLNHRRTIRKKFSEIRENLTADQIITMVADLRARRIIDEDEERYLLRRLGFS